MKSVRTQRGLAPLELLLALGIALVAFAGVTTALSRARAAHNSLATAELTLKLAQIVEETYAASVSFAGVSNSNLYGFVPAEVKVAGSSDGIALGDAAFLIRAASDERYEIAIQGLTRVHCIDLVIELLPNFSAVVVNGGPSQPGRSIADPALLTAYCSRSARNNSVSVFGP